MTASRAYGRTMRLLPLAVAIALLALAAPATANHAPPALVTTNTAATIETASGSVTTASADGSRVFLRTVEQLVLEDDDNSNDIYELSGGTYKLISDQTQAGADPDESAGFAGASTDGSIVYWRTGEALTADDGDASLDLYRRAAGTTSLVSDRVQADPDAAADVSLPTVTPDGSRIYFTTAEPLVDDDDDTADDLYERTTAGTTLISDRVQPGADENEPARAPPRSRRPTGRRSGSSPARPSSTPTPTLPRTSTSAPPAAP